jgi:hypothetical protein
VSVTREQAACTRAAIIAEWSSPKSRGADQMWIFAKNKPLWAVIIICGIVGIILIVLPCLGEWVRDYGVTKEIGIAFLTASILGGTIHVYLERDIAKNAFEGAVGYFLPEDLKEAVHFISSVEWFAEEFSLTVDLEKDEHEPDLIKATLNIRRYLKNITHRRLTIKSTIHVDDWGRRERSCITACEARTPSKTITFDPGTIKLEYSTVYAETAEIPVGAGECVELLATAIEYKHANDDLHFAMPYACK